jgi:hypothetical protein
MRALIAVLVTAVLAGCAGNLKYVRPTAYGRIEISKTIAKPRDTVWNSAVLQLEKQFFVIDHLDKESGFINLSYSGDPEDFTDCGRITSYVKKAREMQIYNFPGARAHQTYEIMDGDNLFIIERKMSLKGSVKLLFEEIGPNSTKITATAYYNVTRQVLGRQAGEDIPQSGTDDISFTSGGSAAFPSNKDGRSIECVNTGKLERDILSLIE